MYRLGRLAIAAVCFFLGTAGCTVTSVPQSRSNLSQAVLTFDDEFNGDRIDLSKWNVISRVLYSNGAVNAYNPAMVSVGNGYLKLDLDAVSYLGKPYSGGEIDSRGKFNQKYGYFEARMKLPRGSGLHSSWWLWPLSDRWPPEIDIIETKGSRPTTAYMTVHWSESGVVRAYPEQMDFAGDHYSEGVFEGPDLTEDFHVFGVEWKPESIVWYIDGVERHRISEHVPQEAFMLELDLALDTYGGSIDRSFLPASLLVDYVRVYRLSGDPLP